jgi:hypothetical protein
LRVENHDTEKASWMNPTIGINSSKGSSKVGLATTYTDANGIEQTVSVGEVSMSVVGGHVEVTLTLPRGIHGHIVTRNDRGAQIVYEHPQIAHRSR